MRIFLGIVAGIVIAFVVQGAADMIGSILYPTGVTDVFDRAQVNEAFANRPPAALLITMAGYFLAALIGGWVARRVSGHGWAAWFIAGLMALMALIIVFAYPLPAWAWFGSLVAPLIGGLVARHLGSDPVAPEQEVRTDADI